MSNGKRISTVVAVMAAVVAGGSAVGRAGDESDVPAATLTSKDKTVQLGLPDGWAEAKLKNSFGKIQAKSVDLDAYVEVGFDAKEDVDFTDLKAWAAYKRDASEKASKLEGREQTDLEAVTINGHAGFRYTISGTYEKLRLSYVVTYVETDRHFALVDVWTIKSHREKVQADVDYLSGHVTDAAK